MLIVERLDAIGHGVVMLNQQHSRQEARLLAAMHDGDRVLRLCSRARLHQQVPPDAEPVIASLDAAMAIYALLGWPEGRRHLLLLRRAELVRELLGRERGPCPWRDRAVCRREAHE